LVDFVHEIIQVSKAISFSLDDIDLVV